MTPLDPLSLLRPTLPLKPETSPLIVDYLIRESKEINTISLTKVNQLILYLEKKEGYYKEVGNVCLGGSEFYPAHLPQFNNVVLLSTSTQTTARGDPPPRGRSILKR